MRWEDFATHIRHLSAPGKENVKKAFLLSKKLHENQQRESGLPYFTHPVAVAEYLAHLSADDETIIAALLHDVVEDTPVTLKEVENQFGASVATMILGLTKLDEKTFANQPTMDEKIETLRRMFTIMEGDVRVMTIKLADRLHNMRTIKYRQPEKQRAVAKETLDIYVKIADRLCMRDLRDALTTLCHGVLEPELHDALLLKSAHNKKRFIELVPTLQKRLSLYTSNSDINIDYEPKSWKGLQLQHDLEKQSPHSSLLLNAAFLCKSVEDCYRLLGSIHQTWPRIVLTFDDFINVPAVNGYRGLQTTVVLENGTHLRCKIRTHGMNAYAHRGIATVCFDTHAKGVLEYLPWTRHIEPLSKDSRERSTTFWETLQSDILSESFVIYGNEHRSVLVPRNATALDGAMYLYPETATRLTKIFVNGKKVPPSHTLMRADIVEITIAPEKQVNQEWLYWSKTGIGSMLIRRSLASEKKCVKIETGKKILQDHLLAHHRGYLSELNLDAIADTLRARGLSNDMNKLYVQIAEGRLLPQDLERILYPVSPRKEQRVTTWVLRCTSLTKDLFSVQQIINDFDIVKMRIKSNLKTGMSAMHVALRLTSEEIQELELGLQRLENTSFRLVLQKYSIVRPFAWIATFVLWGADPVIAHLLLQRNDIHPINLTAIRFLSYAAVMGIILLWMNYFRPIRHVRLSLRNFSLWLSAFLLFLISITSYLALQHTLPLQYTIFMTLAGLLLTSALFKRSWMTQIMIWGLAIAGIGTILYWSPQWPKEDIIFTVLAVACFTAFSVLNERYKREEEIINRTAQYLFLASCISAILSCILLVLTGIHPISIDSLLMSIGFAVGISGAPYYIYYFLLSHSEIDIGLHFSFLIIPATLIIQSLLITNPSWWHLLAGVLISIGAIIPTFRQKVS